MLNVINMIVPKFDWSRWQIWFIWPTKKKHCPSYFALIEKLFLKVKKDGLL